MVSELRNDSNALEQSLNAWQEEIHDHRMKYPELNHFTTQQLLFLRKELAKLRGSDTTVDGLELQVCTLLESIRPELDSSSLEDALVDIGITTPDFHHDEEVGGIMVPTVTDDLSANDRFKDKETTAMDQEKIGVKYASFFRHIEQLGIPDQVGVAALIACGEENEGKLIVWCVQHKSDEDLLEELQEQALHDPKFEEFFPTYVQERSQTQELESKSERCVNIAMF